MRIFQLKFIAISLILFAACSTNNEEDIDVVDDPAANCSSGQQIDKSRSACNETLTYSNAYSETISGNNRIITSNSIPEHQVGLFGQVPGSSNPNAISPQNETYTIPMNPEITGSLTALLSDGPQYSFGIIFNGVELDPIAAEPFPHNGIMDPNVNWEWNLEALNVRIGLDCNNAHVQPTGKYHYHGLPTLFIEDNNFPTNVMTLIGYAADGFPIYYKYAYSNADDSSSTVTEMIPSFELKTGNRPGDGISAPCDVYNGVYSNDYQYNDAIGDLDEANGRTGVTPEYPNGTYYYIITTDFPSIPRYFKGTPSDDFKIGR